VAPAAICRSTMARDAATRSQACGDKSTMPADRDNSVIRAIDNR